MTARFRHDVLTMYVRPPSNTFEGGSTPYFLPSTPQKSPVFSQKMKPIQTCTVTVFKDGWS